MLRAFEQLGLECVLIGAAAISIHGAVRATESLDLFIRATAENVERLKRAFGKVYDDDPRIDEISATDLLGDYPAVRYYPPTGGLYFDVMIRLGQAESFENVESMVKEVDGIHVTLATPQALFELKRDAVVCEAEIGSPVNITLLRQLTRLLAKRGMLLMRRFEYDPHKREDGLDWPPLADIMVGLKRLDNLQWCLEQVIQDRVAGDVIETGVWWGGASIFMRAALKAWGENNRAAWVVDSFRRLPPFLANNYKADASDSRHTLGFLAVSKEQVAANFARYGLLDSRVKLHEGWFRVTPTTAPISRLSPMRIDGDMYESTAGGLVNLYPKLSRGGLSLSTTMRLQDAARRCTTSARLMELTSL